jgi:tetratricopeptide (TPR) repeat protein
MLQLGQRRFVPSIVRCAGIFLLFLQILVSAAILFRATGASAQEGRESAEIIFSRAVLLYDDKKYPEATQELLKAHKLDPRNTNVIYYLALSLSAQGNNAEAEAYLRKGLEAQPKNANLQYLLAYNLRAQGKTEAARQLAESIQLDPASPLVGPSRELLTALKSPRRGDTPFWLELSSRAQYDTNGLLKPNHGSLSPGDGKKDSWGNLLALSTEYAFLRSARWQAAARYDMFQTINYENHKFDFNDHVIGGRVTYNDSLPGGQRYFLTGRAFHDVLLQEGRLFLQRPTGVLDSYLYWDRNGSNRTQLFYQLQGEIFNEHPPRRHNNPPVFPDQAEGDENRDALNHRVGLVHYIFFDRQRYGINFGYHFDREDAKGSNWRYNGYRGVAGFLLTLPWEIRATTNFEFHARYYDGTNSTFHKHRNDQETTVLFGLAKDITPSLTVSLEHLWNSNDSSVGTYSYHRQVYSMGLTWRYY